MNGMQGGQVMDTIADFYRGCFVFVLGLSGGFILGNWGKIFNWWLDWVCGKEEEDMNKEDKG